jgi:hypothetical protein
LSPHFNRKLTNTRFHTETSEYLTSSVVHRSRRIRDEISRWLKSTTLLRFGVSLSSRLGGVVWNRLASRSSLSGAAFDLGRPELEEQTALAGLMMQRSFVSSLPHRCGFLCRTAALFLAGNRS